MNKFRKLTKQQLVVLTILYDAQSNIHRKNVFTWVHLTNTEMLSSSIRRCVWELSEKGYVEMSEDDQDWAWITEEGIEYIKNVNAPIPFNRLINLVKTHPAETAISLSLAVYVLIGLY